MKKAEISLLSFFFLSHSFLIFVQAKESPTSKEYKASDLSGWETVVGDALYTASGEEPVSTADIDTLNFQERSLLRTNIRRRRIMSHNITFKRIIDKNAFDYIHTYRIKFRLPDPPAQDNTKPNGETVEMGIFVWDGANTRLDYGVAYQWKINPWNEEFGTMQYWDKTKWVPAGKVTPDTAWHEIQFVINFKEKTTEVKIDGVVFPSLFSATPKASDWGTEIAARIQAEIVSVWPEPDGVRMMHTLEVKDWDWTWNHQPELASSYKQPNQN